MYQFNSDGTYSARKEIRTLKKYRKKLNTAVDMTPMVDLGFLLISFFVITTELSKPAAIRLIVPNDTRGDSSEIGKSSVMTVLLGEHSVYYYEESWDAALKENRIIATDLTGTGLRELIAGKQKKMDLFYKEKGGRDELMLLIKPSPKTGYKELVDVFDETTISRVKKYALLKITKEEQEWLGKNEK